MSGYIALADDADSQDLEVRQSDYTILRMSMDAIYLVRVAG